ncbi:MAG: hypothetical protein ABF780_06330 [Bifidobacterium aquikefiri]|uniref:Uncharacterized protein n=1 Tax=Bifidobacterium aquikefiri TaxID=1653207 RepID=A0A261G3H7_9BIFI|nr:hypothetical protein [Bifidobacterium aquikefiri]OZG65743.1 hypothetical protein BAQU_1481 [Bifidobacterium aquikefiri]
MVNSQNKNNEKPKNRYTVKGWVFFICFIASIPATIYMFIGEYYFHSEARTLWDSIVHWEWMNGKINFASLRSVIHPTIENSLEVVLGFQILLITVAIAVCAERWETRPLNPNTDTGENVSFAEMSRILYWMSFAVMILMFFFTPGLAYKLGIIPCALIFIPCLWMDIKFILFSYLDSDIRHRYAANRLLIKRLGDTLQAQEFSGFAKTDDAATFKHERQQGNNNYRTGKTLPLFTRIGILSCFSTIPRFALSLSTLFFLVATATIVFAGNHSWEYGLFFAVCIALLWLPTFVTIGLGIANLEFNLDESYRRQNASLWFMTSAFYTLLFPVSISVMLIQTTSYGISWLSMLTPCAVITVVCILAFCFKGRILTRSRFNRLVNLQRNLEHSNENLQTSYPDLHLGNLDNREIEPDITVNCLENKPGSDTLSCLEAKGTKEIKSPAPSKNANSTNTLNQKEPTCHYYNRVSLLLVISFTVSLLPIIKIVHNKLKSTRIS